MKTVIMTAALIVTGFAAEARNVYYPKMLVLKLSVPSIRLVVVILRLSCMKSSARALMVNIPPS